MRRVHRHVGRQRSPRGDDRDRVWSSLQEKASHSDPRYFGYAGARSRFLSHFPGGFGPEGYETAERAYKLAAKRKLDTSVPLRRAATDGGHGDAILAVFNATNLLSQFEKIRIGDVLRGPQADEAVRAFAGSRKTATRSRLRGSRVYSRPAMRPSGRPGPIFHSCGDRTGTCS